MNKMTIEEIYETWVNGNITDAKREIKRMTKSEFFEFIKYAHDLGTTFNQIEMLLD